MKKISTSLLLLAGLAMAVSSCKDDDGKDDPQPSTTMTLSGDMSSSNIVVSTTPATPVSSSATGKVSGTYDTKTNLLKYTVTYSGLTDGTALLGHFHIGSPTVNGPVTIDFKKYDTDLVSPITGEVTLTDTQEESLLSGNIYANLHSNTYKKDGEIRATVVVK